MDGHGNIKIFLGFLLILIVILIIICIMLIINGNNRRILEIEKEDNNSLKNISILDDVERIPVNVNQPIEVEVEKDVSNFPNITADTEKICQYFNIDKNNFKTIKLIYNKILDLYLYRIAYEEYEITIDDKGNILSFKELNGMNNKNELIYSTKEDLDPKILEIENAFQLEDYIMTDCSKLENCWNITWVKKYENIINPYENVVVTINATNGLIVLMNRNYQEPNSFNIVVSKDTAIKIAREFFLEKYNISVVNENIDIVFKKPNFYFEEGGPYKEYNIIRPVWNVNINYEYNIFVDAETGEILGGSQLR